MSTTMIELYELVGRVVHKAQQMEHSLSFLITIMKVKKTGEWTQTNVDEIYNFFSSKTMGKQTYEMFHDLDLDQSVKDPLITAFRERNYVVHELFNDGLGVFLSKDGRKYLYDRAYTALENMEQGNQILNELVFLSVEANGYQAEFERMGKLVLEQCEED